MFDFTFNVKQDLASIEKKLDKILVTQNLINIKINRMAKDFSNLESQITTLNTKVDELQNTVDTEQAQIQASVDALSTTIGEQTALIQQLQDELANAGADQARIDALVTQAESVNAKLDTIKSDLEGTITEQEPEEPTDPQV